MICQPSDGLVNNIIIDNTKIAGVVECAEGCQSTQWDIDQLLNCAEGWKNTVIRDSVSCFSVGG